MFLRLAKLSGFVCHRGYNRSCISEDVIFHSSKRLWFEEVGVVRGFVGYGTPFFRLR